MENKEWFYDVYTRSTYKLDPEKKDVLKKYKQLLKDYKDYCHILRFMDSENEYQLTREETVNYYYCKTCIKWQPLINNSMRYCDKNHCPYYFSYKEILNTRQPIQNN